MMMTQKSMLQRRETRCNLWSLLPLRPSFTLVELLVVIVIISILAGMTMMALAGAQRDAEISKTQSTIRKINEVVLAKWEEFASRALPIELPGIVMRPSASAGGRVPVYGQEIARMRLVALRDLMRMEMPDRITDIYYRPTLLHLEVVYDSTNRGLYPHPSAGVRALTNLPYPSLWSNYREKFFVPPTPVLSTPYAPQFVGTFQPAWNPLNANAELLYFIVASSSSNGIGGLEQFRDSEIGDTDQDGYPEFVDAWGQPIRWIRWPAGADWSSINVSAADDARISENRGGDAMDVTKSDWRYLNDASGTYGDNPFTLQPLIISSGPDRAFDIVFDVTDIDSAAAPIVYATQTPTFAIPGPYVHGSASNYYYPDPYRSYTVAGNDVYLGQIYDYDPNGSHTDNVTSHDTLSDL